MILDKLYFPQNDANKYVICYNYLFPVSPVYRNLNGKPTLKKQHDYYYQIQGTLYVTGRPWCDLFIWTPNGTFTERISYDATFWNIAYRKLQTFYNEFLLPELANPCYPKGQPLRHRQTHTK